MKISNNALNFLLAQYRAIFKRAYVKGIASAVLLTAGLAAGQAQAGILTDATKLPASGDITITGTATDNGPDKYQYIQITGGSGEWNGNVTIQSGTAGSTANVIKGSSSAVKLNGTGTLTINVTDNPASDGLSVVGDTNGVDITISKVDITKGALDINALTGSATLAANIDVGSATTATTRGATLNLQGNTASTVATVGGENSIINVFADGQIKATTDSGSIAFKGAELNLGNGALFLAQAGANSGASITIESRELNADSGSIHVIYDDSNAFTEEFTGQTATLKGHLLVGQSGTLTLNPKTEVDEEAGEVAVEGIGTVTLASGSNTVVTGTLNVDNGTLIVEEGASLNATAATAKLSLNGNGTDTEGTLKISSKDLKNFIEGTGDKYIKIENDGTLGATADQTASKALFDLSGGRIELTDTKEVDLAKTFFFSGSSQAGLIHVDNTSGGTIFGQNLAISKALANDASGTNKLDKDSKLTVEAVTLSLGDSGAAVTEDLGFTSAYTQNLNIKAPSTGGFVLKNEVNLDVTKGSGETGDVNITDPMTIAANGKLNALHGTFETNAALTVSGGTLSVSNAQLDDESYMDTKLALTGTLTLDANGASGKVSVDGSNQGDASTVLDITGATIALKTHASQLVSVEAKNDGILRTKAKQLTDIISANTQSGAGVFISKGLVEVTDDLKLAQTQLSSGTQAANNQIIFDSNASSGGTLQVLGTLTLTGVDGLDISDDGKIIADTLTINNEDTAPNTYADSKLVSGKYLAQSVLNSADKTKNINISGAQVFLGDFNELEDAEGNTYYKAVEGSDSGRIDVNLQLTKAGSGLTVQNGSWTGQSVSVTAGDLNVGLSGATAGFDGAGVKHDVNGDAIGATLTLATLSVSGGKATVAEGSTLNVNDFTVTKDGSNAAGLTVYGTTTVNGNKVSETVDGTTTTTYGVDIGTGSIAVEDGGLLQFKGAALEALQISATSGDQGYINAADSYKTDAIKVNVGGEVLFDFASGTSLSAAQLRELRDEIFDQTGGATVSDGDSGTVTLVAGAINLGQATIAEIKADTDGAYSWDSLAQYSDIIANYTTNDLKSAVVKGVDSGDPVRGHYGALKSSTLNTGSQISIVGDTSLNNAAAQNGIFALGNQNAILGLNATNAHVELNNGGQIGTVALDSNSTLVINGDQGITAPAETVIKSIDGADGSEAEFVIGKTTVSENSDIGNLVTRAGSDVTFKGTLTVGSTDDVETVLAGTSNTFEGEATFNNETEIHGAATFNDGVTFNEDTGIYANTAVTGGAKFDAYTEIGNNATLTADSIELTANNGIRFVVGEEDYVEDGKTHEGSTGYLQADAFKLAGNTLVVDPSYERETSIAYVKNFTDGDSKEDAGIFSGNLIAGQNAALIVGTSKDVYDDAMAVIKGYQNSRGALIEDEVGSLVYIGDKLTAEAGSRIIIDSQRTQDQIFGTRTITGALNDGSYQATYQNGSQKIDADLFLGVNTVMVVSDNILADDAAVHFRDSDAAIMAEKAEGKEHAAKIVLDGNGFLDSRDVTLFTDAGTAAGTTTGVKVLGDQDIRVETLNGVMYFMLKAGEEVTGGTLNLDTTKIDTAFLGATDESRNLLFAYTSQTANWEEYFDEANLAKADTDDTKVQREQLHGDVASTTIANYDATQPNGVALTQAALDDTEHNYKPEDFIAVPLLDEDGKQVIDQETGKALGTVYHRAYNDLLEAIARNTNGAATDSAALQGVFGGAAQAALLAARTSQEAVAGRTGVGASSSALTFADNGQGAGLWVNPIYVSQDSDGFEVGNKDYGVDIDLYGVALGGDYTLANGVRVGAFFNVGSGEADGNGQANGVSNDFDYYGVGLYAGYSVGQFSIVGDVSYSVVDSEIDASTAVGKITSSFDTDNLSVGVTGQYEFDFNGTLVTPHVGLRYSALSVDDYSFKAADYTQGGDASIDDANVFSIPVGVTVAKEFAFNTWTVKPSLDVTVQGNFGDDELDSTAEWDNVAWQSNYSSEFIDNFTYGATLGVAAKTGSFSAGIGLGYQGSSNTDEFSATANARFVF